VLPAYALHCEILKELEARVLRAILVGASKSKYIATRQLFHRSSHAMPHKIFDDVEER
jgi:hypothetical protein